MKHSGVSQMKVEKFFYSMYNNPLLLRPEKFESFALYLILKVITHWKGFAKSQEL
jgi:hypothetical protein